MVPEAMIELVGRYWDGLWNRRDLSVGDEVVAEPHLRHLGARREGRT